jgi:hypothetical protein
MRSNGRASKVPSQRSWPPCHATKPKALWPLAWISATRRAEPICRFLPRRLTHSLPLISPFRQRMRCLSGGLSANRIPDGLMPLPSGEAVAPFGERLHRSLPHTLPGVWFVLRTASQATTRPPPLVVVALLARARPLRVLTRSLPQGLALTGLPTANLPKQLPQPRVAQHSRLQPSLWEEARRSMPKA